MRIFILVALLALGACAREPERQPYPPHYQYNFMQACQARNTAAHCACLWTQIEAGVSRADFEMLERLTEVERAAHPLMQQIEGYAVACAAREAPPVAPAPNGGN